jgi:hypothetical protein
MKSSAIIALFAITANAMPAIPCPETEVTANVEQQSYNPIVETIDKVLAANEESQSYNPASYKANKAEENIIEIVSDKVLAADEQSYAGSEAENVLSSEEKAPGAYKVTPESYKEEEVLSTGEVTAPCPEEETSKAEAVAEDEEKAETESVVEELEYTVDPETGFSEDDYSDLITEEAAQDGEYGSEAAFSTSSAAPLSVSSLLALAGVLALF